MHRIFKSIVITASVAFGLSATGTAAQAAEFTWRLAHYLPEDHFFAKGWLADWAARLETESSGRIDVEIHPNNSLLRLGAIAPGVRDGKAEIGFGPAPESAVLDVLELPFLVASARHGTAVAMRLLEHDTLTADFAGLETVLLQTNAPSLIHTKGKAVRVPADLTGLRMRGATDYIRTMLSTFGARPIDGFLAPQVYGALESDAVDGTIWPYEAMGIFKLGDQLDFHTEVFVFVSALGLFIDADAMANLPEDLQKVVRDLSGRAVALDAAGRWDDEEILGRDLAVSAGNTIIQPNEQELAQWRRVAAPLIDSRLQELNTSDFDAQQTYERMQALADLYGADGEPL